MGVCGVGGVGVGVAALWQWIMGKERRKKTRKERIAVYGAQAWESEDAGPPWTGYSLTLCLPTVHSGPGFVTCRPRTRQKFSTDLQDSSIPSPNPGTPPAHLGKPTWLGCGQQGSAA